MSDSFDPYHVWLGIPPESRPPTHYEMLGISPNEQTRPVIEAAVHRQSAYVRNFQIGKYGQDAARILNEIAAAKVCLLDPAKRAKYDAEMNARQAPANAAPQAQPAAPSPAIDLDQLIRPAATSSHAPAASTAPRRHQRLHGPSHKKPSALRVQVPIAAAVAIVALAIFTFWPRLTERSSVGVDDPAVKSDSPIEDKRAAPVDTVTRPPVNVRVSSPPMASAPLGDVVFADFEGDDYGGWQATGNAFGRAPVRGSLPYQAPVTGFLGNALVNTFVDEDKAKGKLTSPEFIIDRRYITFLIGGAFHERQTCINLLVSGDIVRSAAGRGGAGGGTAEQLEKLQLAVWDVTDLAGRTARIEIVDDSSELWGHVNLDQIVFTNNEPTTPPNVSAPTAAAPNALPDPPRTFAEFSGAWWVCYANPAEHMLNIDRDGNVDFSGSGFSAQRGQLKRDGDAALLLFGTAAAARLRLEGAMLVVEENSAYGWPDKVTGTGIGIRLQGTGASQAKTGESRLREGGNPWSDFDMHGNSVVDGFARLTTTALSTKGSYGGPLEIAVVARTDKDNVRVCAYGGARLIFNWETDPKGLLIHTPNGAVLGRPTTELTPNRWYTLRWRMTEKLLQVFVDDTLVIEERGDYNLTAANPVWVAGGVRGSTIDVKSFTVTSLATAGEQSTAPVLTPGTAPAAPSVDPPRKSADGTPVPPTRDDTARGQAETADDALKDALSTEVKLVAPYPARGGGNSGRISVQYAVMEVVQQAGLQYAFNASFRNTDPACRLWVRPNIRKKTCGQALKAILDPVGLTYKVTDGVVVLEKK